MSLDTCDFPACKKKGQAVTIDLTEGRISALLCKEHRTPLLTFVGTLPTHLFVKFPDGQVSTRSATAFRKITEEELERLRKAKLANTPRAQRKAPRGA